MSGTKTGGRNEPKNNEFSDKLRYLMYRNKLSCADLAGKVGLSSVQINRYLIGTRYPSADSLSKLVSVLGTTERFLTEEKFVPPPDYIKSIVSSSCRTLSSESLDRIGSVVVLEATKIKRGLNFRTEGTVISRSSGKDDRSR
jgi:transcriptional regulator with XRE-family HTH domain